MILVWHRKYGARPGETWPDRKKYGTCAPRQQVETLLLSRLSSKKRRAGYRGNSELSTALPLVSGAFLGPEASGQIGSELQRRMQS